LLHWTYAHTIRYLIAGMKDHHRSLGQPLRYLGLKGIAMSQLYISPTGPAVLYDENVPAFSMTK
jgi:hypothetical protein